MIDFYYFQILIIKDLCKMKSKLFNALLLVSSLVGYLEWGQNRKMFLFQLEIEIFSKSLKDSVSIIHPFILLPLLGQVLLLFTLFQKIPGKTLTYIGMGGIGILLALLFLVGCLNRNLYVISSAIPFFVISYFTIRHNRKIKID